MSEVPPINQQLRMMEHKSLNATWPKFSSTWIGPIASNEEWFLKYEPNVYGGNLYKYHFINNMWRELQTNLPSMERVSMLLVENEVIVHGIVGNGSKKRYITFAGDYTLSVSSIEFRKIGTLNTYLYGSYIAYDGNNLYTVTGVKTSVDTLSVYRLNKTSGLWDVLWQVPQPLTSEFTENQILFHLDELYLFPAFERRRHHIRAYYGQHKYEEYYTEVFVFSVKSRTWTKKRTLPATGMNFPGGESYMTASRPAGLSQRPGQSGYVYMTGRRVQMYDEPALRGTWMLDIDKLQWHKTMFVGPGLEVGPTTTTITPSGRMYCCVRDYSDHRVRVWSAWIDRVVPLLKDLCREYMRYYYGKSLTGTEVTDELLDRWLPAEYAQHARNGRLDEEGHKILYWMERYKDYFGEGNAE